jgi:hypothetical protein
LKNFLQKSYLPRILRMSGLYKDNEWFGEIQNFSLDTLSSCCLQNMLSLLLVNASENSFILLTVDISDDCWLHFTFFPRLFVI